MYLGLLSTLVISGLVFYSTFVFQVWQTVKSRAVSDVPAHVEFVLKFASEHSFPVYSFWYRLVYLFSGFSDKYIDVAITSIILLTVLVSVKYLITYYILSVDYINTKVIALFSFALIFVMPVISYYSCANKAVGSVCITSVHVYLGNIAPNQWHNSTLILAMPFNLLLFYFSVKNIQSEKISSFLIMGILSVISILAKPNYALAFLPILCAVILILNAKSQQYLRAIFKCSLIAVPSILTLVYQWYFTFVHGDLLAPGAKTLIAPFFVWSHYSPHIMLSLLLSIAFPLLVLLLYFKKIDFYLKLSWLTFLVALSMTITFAEYPNWGAGNYFWGSIAANYVLFLFSVAFLLKQPICWKSKLAYVVFGVHFLSGCLLLIGFSIGGFFVGKTSLMF
jgi:hypothetical protein